MTAEIKIKNLYLEQSSSQLRKDAPEFIPGCGVVGAAGGNEHETNKEISG